MIRCQTFSTVSREMCNGTTQINVPDSFSFDGVSFSVSCDVLLFDDTNDTESSVDVTRESVYRDDATLHVVTLVSLSDDEPASATHKQEFKT